MIKLTMYSKFNLYEVHSDKLLDRTGALRPTFDRFNRAASYSENTKTYFQGLMNEFARRNVYLPIGFKHWVKPKCG